MDQNRVRQLENMRKESPDDPFLLYALALEYLGQNKTYAKDLFVELLQNHPDYLATYYHAARLFGELDEIKMATETFEKGIQLARSTGEQKSFQELQNAYQNFLFELE